MINSVRFVPIKHWPRKPTQFPQKSPFKRTYDAALKHLDTELTRAGARNILIQLYLPAGQIRQDGWPFANARPLQPGVILTFEKNNITVSMPCDNYDDWTQNLYAISRSLEALRAVDRYGVTTGVEQYAGFKLLAPPAVERNEDWAYALIAGASGEPESKLRADRELLASAVRRAATKAHPDSPNGSHETFVDIINAREILFPKRG